MKIRMLALLLPFFLMGCSSDDPANAGVSGEDRCAITYRVTAGNVQTRAEAITSSNFSVEGRQFRLYGWMTDTETLNASREYLKSNFNSYELAGREVTYHSGKWSIQSDNGDDYYWPRSKYRVDCYAVYPKEIINKYNASANLFLFTGAACVTGDADVMYATYQGQRAGRDLNEKSKTVDLDFKHIFSQVQFKANKSSELTVTITSLEICNVYKEGTFTIGVIGTDTPSWGETATGLGSYSLPLKSTSVSLTGEAQSLNAADGMLMLIPQTRTKWDTSQTIAANDAGGGAKGTYLKIGCSVTMGGSEYSDNGYVYLPLDIDWTMGYNYTYTLGFGTGYASNGEKTLTDITLTATVTDWVEGTSESQSDIHI